MLPLLGCGACVLALIGLLIVLWLLDEKAKQTRQNEFAMLAARHGFQYLAPDPSGCNPFGGDADLDDPIGILYTLNSFEMFTSGSNRHIENLTFGNLDSTSCYLFDYRYVTGSGKSRTTHYVSAVAIREPLLMPVMSLRESGFGDRLMEHLGVKDIQFESQEFNDRYFVSCSNQKLAYDIIHPQMIDYLMTIPPRSWQINGPWTIVSIEGRPEVMELERAMLDMIGFYQRLPDYVRQDLGFDGRWASATDLR